MIKFDTINGTLCLMLEKAVPLTEDAKFPCVVGYIKDDSLAGRLNKSEARNIGIDYIDTTFIANAIKNNPSYRNTKHAYYAGNMCIEPIDQLEILGYPVQPNSAEWALYRMLRGDVVCQRDNFKRHYKNGNVRWLDRAGIERSLTTDLFLKNFANTIDWQIYIEQPKPLLAEAKIGDLCQRSNGRYTQFHSKHKLNDGTIAYYFDDVSGSTNIDGDHCPHECGNNIVSCEPLAPIGSAEWALQMMKLGKDVCRKGQETAYYHICNDGKEIACSLKNERRLTCGHLLVSKWGETGNDWQLYEPKQELVKCEYCMGRGSYISSSAINPRHVRCPTCNGTGKVEKPAPAFKVGDWAECVAKQGQRKLVDYLGGMGCYKTNYGEVISPCEILRKLSPSEVVVDFGSGIKGTIERNNDYSDWLVINVWNEKRELIAIIFTQFLKPATAALVRELLEKQEGDAK